jgi:glycosyltransferase involved in cell wall biosynthesis
MDGPSCADSHHMLKSDAQAEELAAFTERRTFDDDTILGRDPRWPRMTIVTPTFNQARYLERTILSVLNQNYPNLEYMILDGGSSDGTLKIINKYSGFLSFWRSSPDEGQAAALKEGFQRATGEIMAWVNSDDVYLPGVLTRVGILMKQEAAADVCYGNMYLLDAAGRLVAERRLAECSGRLLHWGIRHGGFGVYQPAAFWRKDLYDRVGGIDPALHFDMDNDLFIRFALAGGRFRFLPRTLVGFRIHDQSKTFTLQDTTKSEIPLLIRRYGLDHASLKASFLRTVVRVCRIWKHVLQGDAGYLCRRLWPHRWDWVS